mmetsp:Transcript_34641/g.55663  ORF Transcript_34641/g.55663 Transcript_34641/m.55663 type:complete len:206 (+) Transcript_34641:720-1337(+)
MRDLILLKLYLTSLNACATILTCKKQIPNHRIRHWEVAVRRLPSLLFLFARCRADLSLFLTRSASLCSTSAILAFKTNILSARALISMSTSKASLNSSPCLSFPRCAFSRAVRLVACACSPLISSISAWMILAVTPVTLAFFLGGSATSSPPSRTTAAAAAIACLPRLLPFTRQYPVRSKRFAAAISFLSLYVLSPNSASLRRSR